jgi:hypothetical protein
MRVCWGFQIVCVQTRHQLDWTFPLSVSVNSKMKNKVYNLSQHKWDILFYGFTVPGVQEIEILLYYEN